YELNEDILADQGTPKSKEWFRFRRERLEKMGLASDPSDRWLKLDSDRRNLSEVYWNTNFDDTEEKSWLVTVINDMYVIRIQENRQWHKKRHYVAPRLP